jgi:integrase/recombinase XerD
MDTNHLEYLRQYMLAQRYSNQSIKTYTGILNIFFKFFSGKDPKDIDFRDLQKFNQDYILKKGYSCSYQNQLINALKLYYKQQPGQFYILGDLERPKIPKRLPVVLSREEIVSILENTSNLKHLTILSTIYACGLRISEAINLKINDIDSNRMIIHIHGGKGNRDRLIGLSPRILDLLRKYYLAYRPDNYLFQGQNNPKYSSRSIQMVLKKGCRKAGILKHVTVHTLRHSFATHLVESGVDVTHVQKLLGHQDIKTTLIYVHIARQFYTNIKSPFDNLNLNG